MKDESRYNSDGGGSPNGDRTKALGKRMASEKRLEILNSQFRTASGSRSAVSAETVAVDLSTEFLCPYNSQHLVARLRKMLMLDGSPQEGNPPAPMDIKFFTHDDRPVASVVVREDGQTASIMFSQEGLPRIHLDDGSIRDLNNHNRLPLSELATEALAIDIDKLILGMSHRSRK